MSKKKNKNRKKKERRDKGNGNLPIYSWQDKEGLHGLIPGERPSDEQVEEMTLQYQENIRKSPYWKKIVKMVGREKAEELLNECRVKID
jgi:hypothetical protein